MHHARAALVIALVLSAGSAHAEPDVGRARDAYDRGVRAHRAGDHAAAARAFAEADALAPTEASLEAALEAVMRADDAALGAELLERAEVRSSRDRSLAKSIDAAKKRFAGRTGTIRVDCKGAARCLIAVDGRAADGSRAVFATVGPHSVVVERGSERFERLVEVGPGATTLVTSESHSAPSSSSAVPPASPSSGSPSSSPPSATAHSPPTSPGISPLWFFVSAGATAIAGTAATISGLDAIGVHDDFVGAGCAPGGTGPKASDCNARADDGASTTLRTNLLVGLTALLAINTTVLGTLFVSWSPASRGGGGTATIGGKLP
jgi:hypothetical protein